MLEVEDRHTPIPDPVVSVAQATPGVRVALLRREDGKEEADLSNIEKVRRFPGGLAVQIR